MIDMKDKETLKSQNNETKQLQLECWVSIVWFHPASEKRLHKIFRFQINNIQHQRSTFWPESLCSKIL